MIYYWISSHLSTPLDHSVQPVQQPTKLVRQGKIINKASRPPLKHGREHQESMSMKNKSSRSLQPNRDYKQHLIAAKKYIIPSMVIYKSDRTVNYRNYNMNTYNKE